MLPFVLQQPDAAVGVLAYAQQHLSIELQEAWFEKLQRWEDALEMNERKQLEVSADNTHVRCDFNDWKHVSAP